MKLGDIIDCANEKDLKQTLRDLDLAGFHAVHDSAYGRHALRITGVPKISYVVKARDGRSAQAAYCDTLEEAMDIAGEYYGTSFQWVEILKGYPGEWETISQSW